MMLSFKCKNGALIFFSRTAESEILDLKTIAKKELYIRIAFTIYGVTVYSRCIYAPQSRCRKEVLKGERE